MKYQEQAHMRLSRTESDFDQIELVRNYRNETGSAPRQIIEDSIQSTQSGLVNLDQQSSAIQQENEGLLMTAHNPPKNIWRIISICVWTFSAGYSDAAPGAILPYIEEYYGISYSIVSLIWMSNALGFILVAMFSHKLHVWFSKQTSLTLGCVLSCIMYGVVASGSYFPLIVAGFFAGGMGLAICLAQSNIFLARLDKQSKYLSFCHASYGLGATISPLIATTMVNNGVPWHYVYLINLFLMVINVLSLWIAFKGAEEDLKPWDNEITNEQDAQDESTKGTMILALQSKTTWLMSFFVLFYQGSEVSIAGWVVTYLLDYRIGDAGSVGYVASGFWGGLTVGRLLLTRPFHKLLGARRSVILMSSSTIVLVILVWVIPSAIAAGLFVAFAGILIGPNYSLLIVMTTQLIPRKIQVTSLTIMTAFGSSGGAIFPFFVGLLSQKSGTYVVLPIFISLYSSMLILWICLPNIERMSKCNGKLNIWQRLW